ncbi:MAG: hypothetical protein RMK84_13305 [Oscillochloridaceae bacterium]|nr:hypothetical protein [Chloroflexaceae bacterium]MDW8391097.1 hypothetical protein [Oscillochloridaceae bacterium]
MKPRRWYSSREFNPHPDPPPAPPLRDLTYWRSMGRTRQEQGPVIKPANPQAAAARGGRERALRAPRPPRRINTA